MKIEYRQIHGGMFLICDDCDLVVGFGDSAQGDQKLHTFKKEHEANCEGPLVFNLDKNRLEVPNET